MLGFREGKMMNNSQSESFSDLAAALCLKMEEQGLVRIETFIGVQGTTWKVVVSAVAVDKSVPQNN
jgi:hypothetical protein